MKNSVKSNIDLTLSIYDHLLEKSATIWAIFQDLQAMIGEEKMGIESFDVSLYKVLYKFFMASGLAIV